MPRRAAAAAPVSRSVRRWLRRWPAQPGSLAWVAGFAEVDGSALSLMALAPGLSAMPHHGSCSASTRSSFQSSRTHGGLPTWRSKPPSANTGANSRGQCQAPSSRAAIHRHGQPRVLGRGNLGRPSDRSPAGGLGRLPAERRDRRTGRAGRTRPRLARLVGPGPRPPPANGPSSAGASPAVKRPEPQARPRRPSASATGRAVNSGSDSISWAGRRDHREPPDHCHRRAAPAVDRSSP